MSTRAGPLGSGLQDNCGGRHRAKNRELYQTLGRTPESVSLALHPASSTGKSSSLFKTCFNTCEMGDNNT